MASGADNSAVKKQSLSRGFQGHDRMWTKEVFEKEIVVDNEAWRMKKDVDSVI